MLIIVLVGALVVLVTLARLAVEARHQQPGAALERSWIHDLSPSSGWTAAMLARSTQSVAVSARPSSRVQARG